ncbi:hypothetical protein ACSFA0_07630 [Variovorax sp. LT1P1]|uniref:hypothetical protein n=1 Tax=Variovorax sp. LT1P1 TaxID=3443730 RepID=UPI003F47AC7F
MTIAEQITERIEVFKACVMTQGIEHALATHILQHDCSIVGRDLEQGVRTAVGRHFQVDAASIYIVGSAKLGFSPKPGQYFKPFSDNSDIDVAIVSKELFVQIWQEVHQMELAQVYFDFDKFKHYHFRGWIRPDKMPKKSEYQTCKGWWDFFRELSGREDFMRMQIAGGLYYDEYFLRQYQLSALTSLREELSKVQR